MGQPPETIPFAELCRKQNYDIDSLDSEIKADRCCTQLLKTFHRWLLDEGRHAALEAGRLAAGADYFLREFMIGARRQNIYQATDEQLRQFGGNWYIINNLEPNLPELEPMLRGASLFYTYASQLKLVSAETSGAILQVANQVEFFQRRIDDFHNLQDDGYSAWTQACPLN